MSIQHILFECASLRELRLSLWSEVEQVCPPNLKGDINVMNSKERCILILNGFNCNYVNEWQDMYNSLSTFIYVMHKKYMTILKNFKINK